MKKCSFCGLENSDESVQCRTCQTPFDRPRPASATPNANLPRKLLPYFLSYFVVTSAVFLSRFIMGNRAQVPFPPHYVILNTTMSSDELVAKLLRAGVPKESVSGSFLKPDLTTALTHHFLLFAVALAAFVALLKLFKRIYPS